MKWITHVALATFFVKLFEITFLIDLLNDYCAYTVLGLYAVMADFDFWMGIEHRTYTHTVYACILASIPLALFSWKLFLVGLIAYASHLFGDMLTQTGLRPLYPIGPKFQLPPDCSIKVGSAREFVLLAVIVIVLVGLSTTTTNLEYSKLTRLKDCEVFIEVSYYENNLVHRCKSRVLFVDDDMIGIEEDGRLKVIKRSQIRDFKILKAEPTVWCEKVKRYRIKHLKVVHDLVVAYYDDRKGWVNFLGTGKDLYFKLYNGSNGRENIKVKIVCST